MCGIGLVLSFSTTSDGKSPDGHRVLINSINDDLNHRLSQSLAMRGPDVPFGRLTFTPAHVGGIDDALDQCWSLTLHASVLHMRGDRPVAQPLSFLCSASSYDGDGEAPRNCALCWNGECYTYNKFIGGAEDIDNECSRHRRGDMIELISTSTGEERTDTILVTELVREAIATSQHSNLGEHEAISKAMGRIHGEFTFILVVPSASSASIYYGRDCLGRRSLLINKSLQGVVALSSVAIGAMDDGHAPTSHDWEEIVPGVVYRLDVRTGERTALPLARVVNRDIHAILNDGALQMNVVDAAAEVFHKLLDRAVHRRVSQAPLPKSQSTTDASVAVLFSGGIDSVVLAALCHRHVPLDQQIDLINVSFFADSDHGSKASSTPDRLAAVLSFQELSERFPERSWRFIAVDVPYLEVLDQERHILQLIAPLDSTMDFNIATAFWFAGRGEGRELGMNEIDEARQEISSNDTAPTCQYDQPLVRFSTVHKANISNESSITSKSIAGANITSASNGQVSSKYGIVISQAKILLSGVGADEQMAGYGRHKTTYQRGGYDALRSELQMEVDRLWTRNLGRDDRCLSDHGKECRFPYLDEDVMAYLDMLPLEMKCDMTRPLGEGDKLILRIVARTIGVFTCSTMVKRAIQFGSRIAKVSDKGRFGSSRQASGQKKIVADNSRVFI